MMSIRSLADFNGSSPGGAVTWLTPPPSPPGPQPPGRHDERGMGTFNWPPAATSTRPHTGTFSRPWTAGGEVEIMSRGGQLAACRDWRWALCDLLLPKDAGTLWLDHDHVCCLARCARLAAGVAAGFCPSVQQAAGLRR